VIAADVTLRVALRVRQRPGELQCRALDVPGRIRLTKGEAIRVQDGVLRIVYVPSAGVRSHTKDVEAPAVLSALAGPLELELDFKTTGRVSRCSAA
jgi:hypothetical protein